MRKIFIIFTIIFSTLSFAKDITEKRVVGIITLYSDTAVLISADLSSSVTNLFRLGGIRYKMLFIDAKGWDVNNEIMKIAVSRINKTGKYLAEDLNDYFFDDKNNGLKGSMSIDNPEFVKKLKNAKKEKGISYLLVVYPSLRDSFQYPRAGIVKGGYGYSVVDKMNLFAFIDATADLYDASRLTKLTNAYEMVVRYMKVSRTLRKDERDRIFEFVSEDVYDKMLLKEYRFILDKEYMTTDDKQRIIDLYLENSSEEEVDDNLDRLERMLKPVDYLENYNKISGKDKAVLDQGLFSVQVELVERIVAEVFDLQGKQYFEEDQFEDEW